MIEERVVSSERVWVLTHFLLSSPHQPLCDGYGPAILAGSEVIQLLKTNNLR